MRLVLNVVRCPPEAVPEQRRSAGADVVLGRGPESDWVLQDPERVLSKRHCAFEFRGGWWQLRDLSTNGTYLNRAIEPVGRDQAAPLSDGDRVRVGAYEIEVRVEAMDSAPALGNTPWGEPLIGGADPARQRPDPLHSPLAPPPLPGDPPNDWSFDDMAPMPDHRPAATDAFNLPAVRPAAAALPDDWDFEIDPPPPAAAAWSAPVATDDPFAEVDAPSLPLPLASAPPPPATPAPPPADRGVPQPVSAEAALAVLLRGAGLPANALPGADPAVALAAAGACLRAAVEGLRALLIARADIKREFRIEQTMLRVAGNNPVKFAATDAAALAALLGDAGGPEAVAATVRDLTAHEVAALAATQAAARALLEKLAPAAIEAEEGTGGGLFSSRDKRLWEAFGKRHAQLVAQFEDDFDSAFGKAFARAYEQAAGTRR